MMRGVVMILVVTLAGCATQRPSGLPCTSTEVRKNRFLRRLVRTETIVEAERRHTVGGVPFGGIASKWTNLKNRMLPGDQLWWFERERNVALQGALEGYVVMRGCTIVDRIVLVTD
jgi:hypothetical protein